MLVCKHNVDPHFSSDILVYGVLRYFNSVVTRIGRVVWRIAMVVANGVGRASHEIRENVDNVSANCQFSTYVTIMHDLQV